MRQNIGSWLMGHRRFAVIDWSTSPQIIRMFDRYEDADRAFKAKWMHSSDFLAWHRKAGWKVVMSVRSSNAVNAPDDVVEWAIELGL